MTDTPTHRDLDILLCCWGDCEADRGRCCATEIADARRTALTAAGYVVEQGWQPIETAPRDGAYMLKNRIGEVCPCQSRDGQRIVSNMPGYADWTWGEPATHWRPFQAAPTGAPA